MKYYVFDWEYTKNGACVTFLDINNDIKALIELIIINHDKPLLSFLKDKLNGYYIFKFYKNQCDLINFIKFINKNDIMLISYNGSKFDNFLNNILLVNYKFYSTISDVTKLTSTIVKDLRTCGNRVIELEGSYWYDDNLKLIHNTTLAKYYWTDLLSLVYETIQRKSLKQTAINLKYPRIQDNPYNQDTVLDDKGFEETCDYNLNDCLITLALYYHKLDIIKLRPNIAIKYNIDKFNTDNRYDVNKYCQFISSNKSRIGEQIFANIYARNSGDSYDNFKNLRTGRDKIVLKDIMIKIEDFKTQEFKNVFETLAQRIVRPFELQVKEHKKKAMLYPSLKSINFNVGYGGLHTNDTAGVFNTDDLGELLDGDLSSFYPSYGYKYLMICPAHLNKKAWIKSANEVIDERLLLKPKAKTDNDAKTVVETLKIVLNSFLFGALGSDDKWVYDPAAMLAITINGEMLQLLICEDLILEGIKILSVNTDGIFCYVPNDKKRAYYDIWNYWCTKVNVDVEFEPYIKYVRNNVNNYIAQKPNGKLKVKGWFVSDIEIEKGYDAPIESIALQRYFIDNTPIEQTIRNHIFTNSDAILDYCKSQKVKSDFEVYLYNRDNPNGKKIQKSIRYYISKDNSNGIIKKRSATSEISLCSGQYTALFNNHVRLKPEDYNIDYRFYIQETQRIIDEIEGRTPINIQTRFGKKVSNKNYIPPNSLKLF